MRDFCNVAERDCIRLIVAQDLKENGIDLDSQNQKHQKDYTINKSNISSTHEPVREFIIVFNSLKLFQHRSFFAFINRIMTAGMFSVCH